MKTKHLLWLGGAALGYFYLKSRYALYVDATGDAIPLAQWASKGFPLK